MTIVRRAILLIFVLPVLGTLLWTSTALADFKLKFEANVAGLTRPAHGSGIYFLADRYRNQGLYFAPPFGKPVQIRLSEPKANFYDLPEIALGGDGRIWIARQYNFEGRKPIRIHIVEGRTEVGTIRLAARYSVGAMAAGGKGTTWITGLDASHFAYFDRGLKMHRVRVPNAQSYDGITMGQDHAMWATSGRYLLRVTRQGKLRRYRTRATMSPAIVALQSSIWLTGPAEIQRVSLRGKVTHIPLQYPSWTPPTSDHVAFVRERAAYVLFARSDHSIGFYSGAESRSGLGDSLTAIALGSVSGGGVLTEELPAGDACLPYDERNGSHKLVRYDRVGFLWEADCTGLYVAPPE